MLEAKMCTRACKIRTKNGVAGYMFLSPPTGEKDIRQFGSYGNELQNHACTIGREVTGTCNVQDTQHVDGGQ